MNYFFKLLIFLTALTSFAQNPGGLINAPLSTELDSLVVLKANKRSAHVPYTNFEAKLKARFDNYYAALGSGFTPTLQQVTTQGATTSNNITIANNDYPRFIIQNTSTNNYATYWDNSIVFSYPGGHAINLLKPASFTGNYTLSIPAITANDTIALKSELVGLGGVSLSGNNTWTGSNTFKNKLLLESLINGYLGGFKITNDGVMEIGDTELQDLSVRIKSFSGLSQINLGDGQINVVGDFNVGGSMVASSFIGDGSGLTGLPSIPTTYAASNITVADAGGLITATTVEGALAENRGLINTNASNIASHETRLDDLEAVTPVNTAFRTVTPSAGVFTEAYNEAQPNISFTITQNTAVTLTTIANGDFGIVEVINATTTPYIVQLNGITNRTRTVINETVSFTYTTNATGVTWYENYKTQATSGSGESTNYAAQTGSGTSVINFTDNNFVDITLTANEVPTFTAPSTTTRDLTLYLRQDATGGRTFTFPTYEWGFAGGTRPTITSTPNALDIFKIDYLGGKYYVTSVMQNLVAGDTPLSYTIEARANIGGFGFIATDGGMNYEGNLSVPFTYTNYTIGAATGTSGFIDATGITWIRDASIPAGLPTADYNTLYDSLRYGDFTYTVPKGNGTYKITLYLAEDQAAQTVGGRVFDVIIEGITVETGIDIRDEFGIGARAVAKIYDNIVITDGVLNLTTNSTTNLVLVAGFQIEKQD